MSFYKKLLYQSSFFYFFEDQNNDHNQPIPVQAKIQLPKRTRIMSCLLFFVWRASHAGASIIATAIITPSMYFVTSNKRSVFIVIFFFCWYYIPYFASLPSSSSILSNWLYFAIRSVRDIEPVFI